MRSRYDHDPNRPDSWPGASRLADWWRARPVTGRWAAGAGLAVAVVLALAGVTAAGGFAGHDRGSALSASAATQADAGQAGSGHVGLGHVGLGQAGSARGGRRSGSAATGSAAGTGGRAPASARAAAKPGPGLRTSCQSVAHIGDSTSVDLISPASLPVPAQRLGAQYRDIGVRHLRIDASGGRSVVEEMPGQVNGYKVASAWRAAGYRGCWVFALGTNDVADVQAGSAVGLTARINSMMSVAHGEPVLWVNTRTELSAGPWANAGEQAWDHALDQALKQYPNLKIFNWSAVAQPAWFLADGIHYNTPGCAIRARDIAAALARAYPARGPSPARIVT
jgi:hypothetical protein